MSIRYHYSPPSDSATRGAELGAAAHAEISVTVAVYERMLHEDVALDRRGMLRAGTRVGHALRRARRDVADEIEAIAEGAHQRPELLFAINARTELLAGGRVATGGSKRRYSQECSVAGTGEPGSSVIIGQTWDFHPELEGARLVWIAEQRDGTWWATFTEAGIVAKTGLNNRGLALTFSFLSSPADGGVEGVPVHVLARCVLEDCSDLQDVESLLRRSRRSASACFSVASRADGARQLASFEITPTDVAVVPSDARGFLAHTNHMVNDATGSLDHPDAGPREESVGRLLTLSDRLSAMDPQADGVTQLREILGVERGTAFPILRRGDLTAPWLDQCATLATLIYDVTATRMWVSAGGREHPEEVALPGVRDPLHRSRSNRRASQRARGRLGGASDVAIGGWAAAGFENVRAAFVDNFRARAEVGAAFAVYARGELVVDLWGGLADDVARSAWKRNTLQLAFSGTKGIVAACVLILVQRDALDLDSPVCAYWREFAANGKDRILVRHLLDHTAGLPGVRVPVAHDDVLDGRRMAALLAEQAAYWPPGSRLSYHALTFGWLLGELVRRVDGRSIGQFVRDEICDPRGLDIWIGLPPEQEHRVARTRRHADGYEPPEAMRNGADEGDGTWSVWENPPLFYGSRFVWNDVRFHAAEIPAANAVATARSMARFYSGLIASGADEHPVLEPEVLKRAITEQSSGRDPFSDFPFRFGLGFQLQTELRQFGPSERAFGHGGAGGSTHGAWPEHGVAFSYLMNEMRSDLQDPRPRSLLEALADSVDRRADATCSDG